MEVFEERGPKLSRLGRLPGLECKAAGSSCERHEPSPAPTHGFRHMCFPSVCNSGCFSIPHFLSFGLKIFAESLDLTGLQETAIT